MSEEAKVDRLIARWISDYRSRALWKKLDEFGSIRVIDAINYDVPAPVLRQTEAVKGAGGKVVAPVLIADDVELRSWLMAELMRCLSNGRDTTTKLAAGAVAAGAAPKVEKAFDRTTLEEAVDILDRIVEETNVSDLVTHSDVSRLRLALKRQSVYVCCRAGKYDLSAAVFERQWTHWKNEREMDARRVVSEVMAARIKDHPTLAEDDYINLINEGRSFLRKAFTALPVPFLIKAARNVCDKINRFNTTATSADDTLNESEISFQNTLGTPVQATPVSQESRKSMPVLTTPVSQESRKSMPVLAASVSQESKKSMPVLTTPVSQESSKSMSVVTTPVSQKSKKSNGKLSSSIKNSDSSVKRGRGRPLKVSPRPSMVKSPGFVTAGFIDAGSVPAVDVKDKPRQPKTIVKEIKKERVDADSDTETDVPGDSSSKKSLPKKRKRNSSMTSDGESKSKERRSSKVTWSTEDEELIFVGALRFGVGSWSEIARALPGRSNLDIKDKWCTMLKQGKVELYEKIHGLLPPVAPSLSLS